MDLEKLKELHCKHIMPQKYEEEFKDFLEKLEYYRCDEEADWDISKYSFFKNDEWLEKAEQAIWKNIKQAEATSGMELSTTDRGRHIWASMKEKTKYVHSLFRSLELIWDKKYVRPATKEDYIKFLKKLKETKHLRHYDKDFPANKFKVLERLPITPPLPVIDGEGFYLIVPEKFEPSMIKEKLSDKECDITYIRLTSRIKTVEWHIFFAKDGSYTGNWVPIYNDIVNC